VVQVHYDEGVAAPSQGPNDPAWDRYEEALLAHLKAKQAGTVPECKPAFAAPQRVVNLMEALRRTREELRQSRRASGREYHAAVRRNAAAGSQP
jgi:non-homologous end joining protein Ku